MTEASSDATNPWNDRSGNSWVRQQESTDAQLEPFGRAVMDLLAPAPGEHVLDVGCGAGQTLLQLAERVGTSGRVVGVDISEPLVARARERVAQAGLSQVELVLSDAASQRFDEPFDVVFSRFGVMFFEDAVAAFQNLRRALRAGGRLGFVCWQALELNPGIHLPLAAVRRLAPQQPAPKLLDAAKSGPFYFADPALVERILQSAGFEQIRIEARELWAPLGGARTLDEAVAFCLEIGPAARFISEADPALVPAMQDAIRQALAPFAREQGVPMSFQAFLVTAAPA